MGFDALKGLSAVGVCPGVMKFDEFGECTWSARGSSPGLTTKAG